MTTIAQTALGRLEALNPPTRTLAEMSSAEQDRLFVQLAAEIEQALR